MPTGKAFQSNILQKKTKTTTEKAVTNESNYILGESKLEGGSIQRCSYQKQSAHTHTSWINYSEAHQHQKFPEILCLCFNHCKNA